MSILFYFTLLKSASNPDTLKKMRNSAKTASVLGFARVICGSAKLYSCTSPLASRSYYLFSFAFQHLPSKIKVIPSGFTFVCCDLLHADPFLIFRGRIITDVSVLLTYHCMFFFHYSTTWVFLSNILRTEVHQIAGACLIIADRNRKDIARVSFITNNFLRTILGGVGRTNWQIAV